MIDETDAGVQRAATDLIALSHSIHSEPELAFEEYRSAAKVCELLRAHDFEIDTGVADMATAFTGTFGSGELVIGICAEYDALPEIGHACGHNIIAASAVGAAIALAPLAERLGITVKLLGTPAEESGGGKVLMLERGVFDGVAAALMIHPGPFDIVGATSLALSDVAVRFTGRAAHASAAPEWGINAGDAVTISQVAIGLLRQHLAPGQQLHGIVSDGGLAPNIVPGHAELLYYLRAHTSESLAALTTKAFACFAAGALATGCTHDIRTVSPTYAELRPDPWLAATYRLEAEAIGRQPLAPELEGFRPLGSTDMGNVTQVLPGIHPVIGLDSRGAVTHQPEFAAACVTESADDAVLDGAKLLARTVIRASEDVDVRARLLDGVAKR
ncbi:M20 family metallopeptidase [Rhodococcus sp. G-MC3]|uniref:M20 family metallopeptidase n=1 Tax=Rhodococcus sp. G-MC3 TaxID=3046209 RepID=UPI0024B8E8F7|nr:M20 family metallopeptidase [Rhodococcus sp. G-MC3]MDJ0395897.1 M20 family metallopeptidase [Rhodococcus sp. G-MC3]